MGQIAKDKKASKNTAGFDTSFRLVVHGKRGLALHKALADKKEKENRKTLGNAIEDVLLTHFGIE